MDYKDIEIPISLENPSISLEKEKCIKCGKCRDICNNEVTVARMYELGITKEPICINCGQCAIYCPTEAIFEKYDYLKVKEYLKRKDKTIVFNIAPAVRVAIGEEFGFEVGENLDQQIVGALKSIGADYVFDITFGADLTIMEEAMELVTRIKENKKLPMFTSCCPAWVKYAEIFYPEILPNLSTCKSPIAMQGTTIKTYFAKKINVKPKDLINIVIAPCTAKKYEIKRNELNVTDTYDTDYILTTRELAKLLKEEKVDLKNIAKSEFDSPLGLGTGAAVIFGNTGGVMEAALRTAYFYLTGKDLENNQLVFSEVRGMNGIKETKIDINGLIVKVAIANGMKNAKKLLDKMKEKTLDYQFIEVMNCSGGCIAGGGQPKTTLLNMNITKKKRIDGLYLEDEKMIKRVSYKNPDIVKIYREFYEKPNSKIAHQYLHTTYTDKSILLKGGKLQ